MFSLWPYTLAYGDTHRSEYVRPSSRPSLEDMRSPPSRASLNMSKIRLPAYGMASIQGYPVRKGGMQSGLAVTG